ncbi:MAG: amidohydrolase [Ilumatobacteraceae bacterium]
MSDVAQPIHFDPCGMPFGPPGIDRPIPARHRPPADDTSVVVYPARTVLTMNEMAPRAEAVAVQGDTIRAVGSREAVESGLRMQGADFTVDDRFADAVLLPGFIEAHCHASQYGLFWQSPYLGRNPRVRPDGTTAPGCASLDAAVDELRKFAAEDDGDRVIMGWGFDPALLPDYPSFNRHQLDDVSATRPVLVINLSGHIFYANSVALDAAGYGPDTDIQGVVKDADGNPTGELHELEAAAGVFLAAGALAEMDSMRQATWDAGRLAQRVGCTTFTDLAAGLLPGAIESYRDAAADPNYPLRVSYYVLSEVACADDDALAQLVETQQSNDVHLRCAGVKFVTDGSIQGYTAWMDWPYYYDGHPNGFPNFTSEELAEQVRKVHDAGVQIALHANGDATTTLVINAVEEALRDNPRDDHRHRIEHNQLANDAQLTRMARLGMATNLFVNHVFHWGDFHASHTLGPDRVKNLDPCASARRHGVHYALHSDCWVTPLDPLHTVWTAATRKSRDGQVLGPDERISVDEALRAVTIDSAWILFEDHLKGTIEPGKLADLVALDAEPTDDDVDAIPDIEVVATIMGGRVFET